MTWVTGFTGLTGMTGMMGITGITGMMGTPGMTCDEGDGLTRATGVTGASKERYEGEGENVSIAGRTNNYKQQGKIEPLSQWTLEG